MKKTVLALAVTFIFLTATDAQQVHFGIKAGYNSSAIKVEDGEDFEGKSGLHVGGLAHIHLTKHWAVQPELIFSMQGGEDGDEDYRVKLNYINVPVLAQYMFSDGFRVQTGPQVGVLASAEVKVDNLEIDSDDQYNSIDFAWVFGAGYLFKSGLGIDARYNVGISNIRENNDWVGRNRVFQLGLFYQFMHKKR